MEQSFVNPPAVASRIIYLGSNGILLGIKWETAAFSRVRYGRVRPNSTSGEVRTIGRQYEGQGTEIVVMTRTEGEESWR